LIVVGIVAFALIMSRHNLQSTLTEEVNINEIISTINNYSTNKDKTKIEKIVIEENQIKLIPVDKTEKIKIATKEPLESFSTLMKNYNIDSEKLKKIPVEISKPSSAGFWFFSILPILIPIVFIGVLIYITMRQMQGMNSKALMFGQSGAREFAKDGKAKTTFQDVAGSIEAKNELQEIVEFLKSPQKFTALGARIPKGVLLIGAPGTGKTLIARAVAGEADVPFFHISGSEFVEMFVGVGASRVRDLFKRAKASSPCIIFVDEIDAVGRQRGAGLGGSHDEREQTLNQILVEMDGFDATTNVIIVAATNRPDVLDPALLRPGRFDRRVVLDLPDIREREDILKLHSKNKPLQDVNLRNIAERTPGFSGADLSNLLNEAAILAARTNLKHISADHVLHSIDKVLLGPERKSHIISDVEKKMTAYHEAGHALVAHKLPGTDPVRKISIISRGRIGGFTLKLPTEERHFHKRSQFINDLAVLLGGYIVEKEILGELTTGPCNDLKEASKLARKLVTQYGMSDLIGPQTFDTKEDMIFLGRDIAESKEYGDKVADIIDKEITKLITQAQIIARKIIARHRPYLDKIVEVLLVKETIEQEEFAAIFKT